MPTLAELQRTFARAVLSGEAALPAHLFAPGPIPAAEALGVYRDTVLGGLADALALACPTVRRLVGEAFFDQAAVAYARAHPPAGPCLARFGRGFPEFLEIYPPAAELLYLGDVARLDLAIDEAAAAPGLDRLLQIGAQVRLSLPVSLAVLELQWPALQIRDALEDDDEAALPKIDLSPEPRWCAVWRKGQGAAATPLSAAPGRFLKALLAGAEASAAMDLAAPDADRDEALLAIQAEVFAASFTQVVVNADQRTPQPCSP
jgi:hypothetical protein